MSDEEKDVTAAAIVADYEASLYTCRHCGAGVGTINSARGLAIHEARCAQNPNRKKKDVSPMPPAGVQASNSSMPPAASFPRPVVAAIVQTPFALWAGIGKNAEIKLNEIEIGVLTDVWFPIFEKYGAALGRWYALEVSACLTTCFVIGAKINLRKKKDEEPNQNNSGADGQR